MSGDSAAGFLPVSGGIFYRTNERAIAKANGEK